MSKFKVGDRVRFVDEHDNRFSYMFNKEGVVKSTSYERWGEAVRVQLDGQDWCGVLWAEYRFELVSEKPPTDEELAQTLRDGLAILSPAFVELKERGFTVVANYMTNSVSITKTVTTKLDI